MQAIWKGSVAFGLVNIPVKAFVATDNHDVSFRQVHAADGGRIQYKKVCSVCGETVQQAQIAKGYETETGEMLVLDDADFKDLPVRTSHEIDVVEFVPAEQVDPILFDKTYYLEPDGKAVKAYRLLREALRQTDRTAVVMVTLRQKTHLAALRVYEDVITLQTLLWPDEVRPASFPALDEDEELRPQELAMASSLVESMASDFDPAAFTDEYREAVLAMIESKVGGGSGVVAPVEEEEESRGEVLDLMAALEASVARARAGTEKKATTDNAPAAEPKPEKVRAVKSTSKAPAKKTAKAPAKAASSPRSKPTSTASKAKSTAATKPADSADAEPTPRRRAKSA
jgi:DNA end-binding protein Ku